MQKEMKQLNLLKHSCFCLSWA